MLADRFEDNVTFAQIKEEYLEAIDIFPALHKYKKEHSIPNLQKLCIELSRFCSAIYASTQSHEEREVYRAFVAKLNK